MPWTVTQYGWLCGFRSALDGKTKRQKHPLLCYFASYFSCRIEKKKLKKLQIKIAVYTSPSKDRMPICVPFCFSFRGLKTIFQPQNVFTLYKFSVYNVQFICHLVFTSLFKAQKQFTSTGLKECQAAKPSKEESKLRQKNIEGKKSKQSILQKARLSFEKTPTFCHCHNSALTKSQRRSSTRIVMMMMLTKLPSRCHWQRYEGGMQEKESDDDVVDQKQ